MVYSDSYTPDRSYYECHECGYRERAETLGSCPDCDGRTRNIAVSRE
ncbi:rubrerythrin-like domain-containing protein [Natrialbaceae archaeon A-arb3/5]